MDTIDDNTNGLIRRNSTGTLDMKPSVSKVLSRYLRGTTASCHDNCKLGFKQETETKPISPFPKRVSTAFADRTSEDAENSVQRIKKTPSSIPRPARDSKGNNTAPKDEVIKREISPSSTKKKDVIEPKSVDLKPTSEAMLAKAYSLPLPRAPRRRLSELAIPNRDLGSILEMSPVGSSSSKKNIKKTESRNDSKVSALAKKFNSVKSTVPSPKTPANGKSPRKAPALRTLNSFPNPEIKVSRKSNLAKPIEEIVPEKTLYVIELNNADGTQSPTSPPTPESLRSEERVLKYGHNGVQISPPSTADEIPVDDAQNNNVEDLGVSNTRRAIRLGKLTLENKNSSPGKLKFSRGKVTGTRSENNSPRKLRFRQGKVLGEDQNVKAESSKRSLRRMVSDVGVQSPKHHSVTVVLKHQDVEEKKDPQGLINNVIEETASKLIQTRKSKVKALVGAFENLISLTDQKPQTIKNTKVP